MNTSFQPGEPFNPYRLFTGLFIPEVLCCYPSLSAGAKLAWGRLARYAGMDGRCYPTMKTLGDEIGVGERQAQKYVAELENAKLVRRISRYARRAQTSNAFEFLWHELFTRGVNDRSPKESHLEESPFEESHQPRPGLAAYESQKARFARGLTPGAADCKQYPRLREALVDYMREGPQLRKRPTDRQVVDIMDAARPATEREVIDCLRYLRHERGLTPGTRNGPRHFSWFRPVVAEYFQQRLERRLPAAAQGGNGLDSAAVDGMTDAIEIGGAL